MDTMAVVRRFVELGATRSRVHAWVTDLKREASAPAPAPDPAALEAARKVAAAAAVEETAQLASLATARDAAAVLDSLPAPAELAAVAATVAGIADTVAAAAAEPSASVSLVPTEARAVLDQLGTIQATCNKVLLASLGTDGKVRNAKQALNAVEALRRCLETSLKLYESVSNVQQIETFMAEMLAEVRPLAPELAQAVVARMRKVQTRWSRPQVSATPKAA
ncbi:MAG TPA: hypothetical protein VGC15_06785 [Acetobacteraceae bacterium]